MDEALLNYLSETSIDNLSLNVRAAAFYQGTAAVHDFTKKIIIPQLSGLVRISAVGTDISDKDKAIICTFYRMYALVGSTLELNHILDYQTVTTNARTLMELLFDLHILTGNIISNPIEKYWAFPQVEIYRVSKIVVKYTDKNCDSVIDDSVFKDFLKKHTEEVIISQVTNLWGVGKNGKPKIPKHWTGLTMASRAEKLSRQLEDQYINFNAMLSWNIHSGSVGHAGLKIDADTFKAICGHSHGMIQALFLEATSILSKVLELTKAIDWIDSTVEELKLVPGKYLLDKEIEEFRKHTEEVNEG